MAETDANGTLYVVLELVSVRADPPVADDRWAVMAKVRARTPEKAIEQAVRGRLAAEVSERAPTPAFCVAIPVRSWTPQPVTTAEEVTVKIG